LAKIGKNIINANNIHFCLKKKYIKQWKKKNNNPKKFVFQKMFKKINFVYFEGDIYNTN